MHPLEKKILHVIREQNLLPPGTSVITAVSGGSDSMALLHLLAGLARQLEISLIAAHVDHGLRPDEAGAEEDLVRQQAEALGVPLRTIRVQARDLALRQKISLEEAARMLRYDFLEATAREFATARIAVGHTADDQAEGLLLSLLRGTGRKGLAGMMTLRDNLIVRPLLHLRKSELLAYLTERHIPFLEDSSNTDRRFPRNRIRHDLMPLLAEKFNPGIQKTLIQTASILQEEEEFMAEVANRLYQIAVSEEAAEPGAPLKVPGLTIELDRFVHAHAAIQSRVLESACHRLKAKPQFRQIMAILRLAKGTGRGSIIHLADGLRVLKEGNQLRFFFPAGVTKERGNLLPELKSDFSYRVEGPGVIAVPEIGQKFTFEILDWRPIKSALEDGQAQHLDLDALTFPLTLRSIRPGDRFQPLGAPGRKKVNDFLTDIKLPRSQRQRITALLSADTIAALPGLRPDHHFRVTLASKRVLKITISAD